MSRKPTIPCIAQEDVDAIVEIVKEEFFRRVRLLPDAIAPQLVGKSAAEIEWIMGEAVNRIGVEVDAIARAELDAVMVFKAPAE